MLSMASVDDSRTLRGIHGFIRVFMVGSLFSSGGPKVRL